MQKFTLKCMFIITVSKEKLILHFRDSVELCLSLLLFLKRKVPNKPCQTLSTYINLVGDYVIDHRYFNLNSWFFWLLLLQSDGYICIFMNGWKWHEFYTSQTKMSCTDLAGAIMNQFLLLPLIIVVPPIGN